MKCSACYATNDPWVTVCLMCGEAVVPVELCPNGHILPPGSRDCPLCPSMWPDVPPFTGPRALRGVLLVERGVLDGAEFIEIRDAESPLAFVQPGPGQLRTVDADAREATVRILMRPDGVSLCLKPGKGKLVYEPLKVDDSIAIGGVQFRHIAFETPKDFGDVPATVTRSGRRKKS